MIQTVVLNTHLTTKMPSNVVTNGAAATANADEVALREAVHHNDHLRLRNNSATSCGSLGFDLRRTTSQDHVANDNEEPAYCSQFQERSSSRGSRDAEGRGSGNGNALNSTEVPSRTEPSEKCNNELRDEVRLQEENDITFSNECSGTKGDEKEIEERRSNDEAEGETANERSSFQYPEQENIRSPAVGITTTDEDDDNDDDDDDEDESLFHIEAAEDDAMAEVSVLEDPSCFAGMAMGVGMMPAAPHSPLSPAIASRSLALGLKYLVDDDDDDDYRFDRKESQQHKNRCGSRIMDGLKIAKLGRLSPAHSHELLTLPSLSSRKKSSALLTTMGEDDPCNYSEPTDVITKQKEDLSFSSRSEQFMKRRRSYRQRNSEGSLSQAKTLDEQQEQQVTLLSLKEQQELEDELEEVLEREANSRAFVIELQTALRKSLEENEDLLRDVQKLLDTCNTLDNKRRSSNKELRKMKQKLEFMEEQKELMAEELELERKKQIQKEEIQAVELHQQLMERSAQEKEKLALEQEVLSLKKEYSVKKKDHAKAIYSFEKTCQKMRDENKLLREERFTLQEKLQSSQNQSRRRSTEEHASVSQQNVQLQRELDAVRGDYKRVSLQLKEVKEDQGEAAKAMESYYSVELKNSKKKWNEERKAMQSKLDLSEQKVEKLTKTLDQERGFKTFAWRRIRQLEILVNSKPGSGADSCTSTGTVETAQSSWSGTGSNVGSILGSVAPGSNSTNGASGSSASLPPNLANNVSSDLSFFALSQKYTCENCGGTMFANTEGCSGGGSTPGNNLQTLPRRLVSKIVPTAVRNHSNNMNGSSHDSSTNVSIGGASGLSSFHSSNSYDPSSVGGSSGPGSSSGSRFRDELEKTSRGGASEMAIRQDLDRLLLRSSEGSTSSSLTGRGYATSSGRRGVGGGRSTSRHAKPLLLSQVIPEVDPVDEQQDQQEQEESRHSRASRAKQTRVGYDQLQEALGLRRSSC